MEHNNVTLEFIDDKGTFRLNNPDNINEMYFPLCNEAGLMSSITPILHGDLKTGQHSFILPPVSIEDLYNSKAARNFWFYVNGKGPWSATGNSAEQNARRFTETDASQRTIEAGFLWHRMTYDDKRSVLESKVLSFVPANQDKVEIMVITIENTGNEEVRVTPTSAIPLYGKSAENIRDHRHVTSLLNRLTRYEYGIAMKPEIVFDERGHRYNNNIYYVLGSEGEGALPIGSFPVAHTFIGKNGGYDWPEVIVKNLDPELFEQECVDGMEYVGALRFRDTVVKPGEKKEYIILTGTCDGAETMENIFNRYNTTEKVMLALEGNKKYWADIAGNMVFTSGVKGFANWMRWVGVQPVFRKIYGCSFLPYHDYGKGGRGWRDLWQDCLSLILQNPESVRQLLFNNFAGVRIDGTNATIIGSKPGEFIADRNNIARVWMDHGAWPYLTTKLYIDQSGDFSLLFERQSYFRDALVKRASRKDEKWNPEQGQGLKAINGDVYKGTLLEHVLIQHLTCFFNVGEHNMIRLEGADWNDTLDMARERGESTAFTALYASNLISLSELLLKIEEALGMKNLEILDEIRILLDSITGSPDYNSIDYKKRLLDSYLEKVSGIVSGKRLSIGIKELAQDLRQKGEWLYEFIGRNEWIKTADGDGFFNGYYNNDGQRVDGESAEGIRMNLTGQVFTTMFGLATDEQVAEVHKSSRKYLKDPITGGFRLNTPLGDNKLNFGRGFAFAYGEKENGATFCHMAVMYMNALYKRNFVTEAYEVFKSLFDLSMNLESSSIYPGIPEYFSAAGKGMYHYLTGSASWLLLTVLNEMYGVRGEYGDLVISPKLKKEQFDEMGVASVSAWFRGVRVNVKYRNEGLSDYGEYGVAEAKFNGRSISEYIDHKEVRIPGEAFTALTHEGEAEIRIYMASR